VLPREPVEFTSNAELARHLCAAAAQEGFQGMVLGLPLGPDGQWTEMTRRVGNFARRLENQCRIPVHLVDETLSSREAEEELRALDLSAARKKSALDSQSAVLILKTYLESAARG
jgi:putative Holliday junction resolvase